jgi:hypothetical protein
MAAHPRFRTTIGGEECFYCPRCQQIKPRSQFHASAKSKDGIQTYCKPCNHRAARDGAKARRKQAREERAMHRGAMLDIAHQLLGGCR